MPFEEIKQPSGFIRIKPEGKITISTSLKKFLSKPRLKLFHDKEKHLIGFQPSTEGYKIRNENRLVTITCHSLSKITQGEFYPKWDKKLYMLVITYDKV